MPFGDDAGTRHFTESHTHREHLLYDEDDHDEDHHYENGHGYYSTRPIDTGSVKDVISQLPVPMSDMTVGELTRKIADGIDRQMRREVAPEDGVVELALDDDGQRQLGVKGEA